MKNLILLVLLLTLIYPATKASDIIISESIQPKLSANIASDLNLIETIHFNEKANPLTLDVMGLETLTGQSAKSWLNERVSYIISEDALSFNNLILRNALFLQDSGVQYPHADVLPYSLNDQSQINIFEKPDGNNSEKSFTVMNNIGSAIYMGGKKSNEIYGMNISRGFKKTDKVIINSPRIGIIQIGKGLFARELMVNNRNAKSFANSIFHLGVLFHEARHSDGNGKSLAFAHAICPAGHDYAGQAACDENLNGPYMVGALMMAEMTRASEGQCSLKEREMLKLVVVDSLMRVLKTTHTGEASTKWDATPETL